ncbi:MAG: acetate--CoA ligase family protein [Pirellulales bacterium]
MSPDTSGERGSLDAIFSPRSVALIGASRDAKSMGGTLARNLVASFRGPLYFVHPFAHEILGKEVWRCVTDIPASIELAIIAVPAAQVRKTLEQCLDKSVRGLIVISAGFAETGEAGEALERELEERLADSGVLMVGPNCLGVLNTDPTFPLNATFSLEDIAAGGIAVCTQSGALGFVVPDAMHQWRLGVSHLISLGNKLDIGENDVLAYWSDNPRVRVVQLYLESFQDPRGFLTAARRVARRKPLLVLRGGRSVAGTRAAGSHTAALASPTALSSALIRQAGGIMVESLSELFAATALLSCQPACVGNRVAVLTNAGGPGVLCVDALESAGMSASEFSQGLQLRLRSHVPPQASVANPVDLIGSTAPREFAACLRELLDSDEVDQVIVIYVPRLAGTSGAVARAVIETATAGPASPATSLSPSSIPSKPLAAVFMESSGPPPELQADSFQIPSFEFPEMAARAMSLATRYARWRQSEERWDQEPIDQSRDGNLDALSALDANGSASHSQELVLSCDAAGWAMPKCVESTLNAYGLETPATEVAHSSTEVIAAARRMGYPVTIKAVSPTVLHKSRVGGVVNDVRNDEELAAAYQRVLAHVPDSTAVVVQAYILGGREVFIGLQREARFGLVIGVGRGGVEVERQRAVAFRLAPLRRADIAALIEESQIGEWLLDDAEQRVALEELIGQVDRMGNSLEQLVEADFNPVSFRSRHPPMVLDARLRFRSTETVNHG